MKQESSNWLILPESHKAGGDREGEGETEGDEEVGRHQVDPGALTGLGKVMTTFREISTTSTTLEYIRAGCGRITDRLN